MLIGVSGLPAGNAALVQLSGPGGVNRLLDSTATLGGLAAGRYSIVAQNVVISGTRYSGTPSSQTVDVGADARAVAATIVYAAVTGRLDVQLVGLADGLTARVDVVGPNGVSRSVSTNTGIDLLEPGPYSIVPVDVTGGARTYRAASQQITLAAGAQPRTVIVEYGPGLSTMQVAVLGLPFDVAGAVSVIAPDGTERRLTASSVLTRLEAGTYTVSATRVVGSLISHRPALTTQTIVVAAADTSDVAVAYTASPLGLRVESFVSGLTQADFLTAPPGDARQFIVERAGRVKLVKNGVVQATPFLDITSRVNNSGERGMLSMTFDPDYASNGYVYVYYVALNGNLVLDRIQSSPGADVATTTYTNVITIPYSAPDHHGGMIEFGPDRMLYLGPGDGGCCGDPQRNAQNLFTLLGKLLRIDVRALPYTIPAGGAFGPASALPEIWAYGLRNPWRFSFDGPGGMLYIGDVGQDAREEVNAVPATIAGNNFGWSLQEGSICYNPGSNCVGGRTLIAPVAEYPHSEGCSVIGGFVYRGLSIPELTGHYLYADFCRGWLRTFRMQGGRAIEQTSWPAISVPRVNSFGRDGVGELYMVSATAIWKIVRDPG